MSESGREASRMSGSGREAILDVREWSGGPPGCLGVVERTSRMSGSCQETLSDCGRPSQMGMVGSPSSMSESGREAFPEFRVWSGGPPVCTGVVGMFSWMCRSGREALLDDREWPGDLPG